MKLYQINAEDLATLEELVPLLVWELRERLNETPLRMKARRLKDILSNVRWEYGPPAEIEKIEGDAPPRPM